MIIYPWQDVVNYRLPKKEDFNLVIQTIKHNLKVATGITAAGFVGEADPKRLSFCDDLCLLIVYEKLYQKNLVHLLQELGAVAAKNYVRVDYTVVEQSLARTNMSQIDPKYARHIIEAHANGNMIIGKPEELIFLNGDKSSWCHDDLRRVIADTDRTIFNWQSANETMRCRLLSAILKRAPYVAAQMLESEHNIMLPLDAKQVEVSFRKLIDGEATKLLSKLMDLKASYFEGLLNELQDPREKRYKKIFHNLDAVIPLARDFYRELARLALPRII